MARGSRDLFTCVRTEGGLLPPDLLQRVAALDRDLGGLTPEDYGLEPGDRLNEAINRAWNRLLPAWAAFDEARSRLEPAAAATGMTRQRWLLPLIEELGYGRLSEVSAKTLRIETPTGPEERSFAISHFWRRSPLHLVGCGIELDRRTAGVAGAARSSPHGLVQEFLNAGEDHLWGIVSNGLRLRLLRDSARLSRAAFLEFDLEAIFQGEAYADFVLLWLNAHATRLAPRAPDSEDGASAERPEECRLEQWVKAAEQQGTRALDALRTGVEEAIKALGSGFLAHPANQALRERLRSGALDKDEYYRELLRLVYRLLFLFTAEDRDLLRTTESDDGENGPAEGRAGGAEARERYRQWYSTERLRRRAERRRGGPHPDLFQGLRLVMKALGSDRGAPELGLPPLGGWLWSDAALPDLVGAEIANRDLLGAVRALAFTEQNGQLRSVDFRNLGSEELGSVYESLLELHPVVNAEAASFELQSAAGSERKTTGSYYTPTSLIHCLLDSALDPVMDERLRSAEEAARKAGRPAAERTAAQVEALLSLRICDPACGSGHFLIAAAHRLARRVAAIRTGEAEPAPGAMRAALREVIGRCLYGVDLNPMAVELCKVNLWLEALVPGRPLSFLDHHVRCGNSLLGVTPALLARGIPDEAFEPLTGDDRAVATARKKDNRAQMGASGAGPARTGRRKTAAGGGQTDLQMFFQQASQAADAGPSYTLLRLDMERVDDSTTDRVRRKEELFRQAEESEAWQRRRLTADAWCAAFVWPLRSGAPEAITTDVVQRMARGEKVLSEASARELRDLSARYRFFHWHLAFPEVFAVRGDGVLTGAAEGEAGWEGGFDCVLGNPPWERVKLQEKEFFAVRRPEIAEAPNAAARRKRIEKLADGGVLDRALLAEFQAESRRAEGESQLLRRSGRFPLAGRGDVNTYAVFAELMRGLVGSDGRAGIIVPSGIATDDTTKHFFADLVGSGGLASLYDFQSSPGLFMEIGHARFKFSLMTMAGPGALEGRAAEFAFCLRDVNHLGDGERRFALTADDLALLNPNTRTCPIFRTRRDAEITKGIYRRVPVLIREGDPEENPWGISFARLFDMSNDSGLFRTREQLEREGWKLEGNRFVRGAEVYLPLYEAKMVHHFDHRFGDYAMRAADSESTALPDVPVERLQDPRYSPLPRYWVPSAEVEDRLAGKWDRGWLLGWRDICRSTDERTVIAGVVPRVGVGHTTPLFLPGEPVRARSGLLMANLNSFALDFVARQKVGGTHLTYGYLNQLPILRPDAHDSSPSWLHGTAADWILPRVLELTYTAWDLQPFARDCGYDGPPFRWDEERRFQLRCELDAAFFHLYGIGREDADYILDTFPIVRRKDEKKWGEYRTKKVVMELYDRLGA